MNNKLDYYEMLGVKKDASPDELKKAYRKQALEWHPDRHRGSDKEEAEKKFKEINEAYQILSDPQKKSAYDTYGHQAFTPGGGASAGNPFSGFGNSGGGSTYYYSSQGGGNPFGNYDFNDPFDIFEQFFGGSPFGSGRATKQKPRYSLDIEFMDAVNGVEKDVSINGKKKSIKIPAGVDEGSRIEFTDFILSVNIKPHPVFERDGADIYTRVNVPYSKIIKGGEVVVPTIEGDLKVRIREGTVPGTMLRLKGKGIANLRHKGHGDQYIKIFVEMPKKLNKEQKKLVEEMENLGL